MTRFARAKGSKASNERLPEQATSWSEMKQQLLEKNKELEEGKKRKEIIDQRNASYKAFLEQNEEDKIKNSKWADFPEMSKPHQLKKKTKLPRKNLGKKISSESLELVKEQDSSEDEEFTLLTNKIDNNLNKNKVKSIVEANDESHNDDEPSENESGKKKIIEPVIEVKNDESDSDAPPEEDTAKKEIIKPVIKIKKQKKKLLKIVVNREDSAEESKSDQEENSKINKKKRKTSEDVESTKTKKRKLIEENGKEVIKNKKAKRKKLKNGAEEIKQKPKIVKENLTEKELRKIEKKKLKRIKQVEKKKRAKEESKKQKEAEMKNEQEQSETGDNLNKTDGKLQANSFNKTNVNNSVSKKPFNKSNNFSKDEKKAKINNEEKPQRKKPFLPHKMFIHDKEVQIDYVEGFPIKKEDAERLKKLRREMISKGLPRSEINAALKLERRRAERTLANLKKKACFHCRKSGHNLSECPELDKNEVAQTAGSGICFKCGSTEHTHFQCKVVRGQEYKFAQCFICNEQGHISRQCPDNARGLYPKGGACHVCGDVTHLKRDCPKYQAQQQRQEDALKIEVFGNSNPDVLEENSGSTGGILSNKRQNKVIKF